MVVGAESIGESGGFDSLFLDSQLLDSLLLESSSSSSTSSSSAGLACVTLASVSSGTDNLDSRSCPLCDLKEPRMDPQPFVRLLFSFTCGFERMQPLKSSAVASVVAAGVDADCWEMVFAFGLASDVNLRGLKERL